MTTPDTSTEARPASTRTHRRRWAILAVLCLSLLMVVIDNTIVNVALPTLSDDLDASTTELQWMVDAYTLVFSALLAVHALAIVIALHWTRSPPPIELPPAAMAEPLVEAIAPSPVVEAIGAEAKSRFTGRIPKLTVEVK